MASEETPTDAVRELSGALRAFVVEAPNQRLSYPATSSGLYTRVLLNGQEDPFQIVLAVWAPGSASLIHDHDGVVGAVAAVVGETEERKYQIEERRGSVVRLTPGPASTLAGPVVSEILPDEVNQLHEMGNTTGEWAATIHIYLTPIRRFNVYRPSPDGSFRVEPQELWFDAVNGLGALNG